MDALSLAAEVGKILLGLLPLMLAFLAGGRGERLDQTTRALEIKDDQLRIAADRPIAADRLRGGSF